MPNLFSARPTARVKLRKESRDGHNGLRRRPLGTLLVYIFVVVFAIWVLWPYAYTLKSSFTGSGTSGSGLFANYNDLFSGHTSSSAASGTSDAGAGLLPAIGQSFLVSSILVVLDLILAGIAAYGLSRYPFRGSHVFHLGIIVSRVVPAIAIIGPFFVLFRNLNMLDSPWALVISYNVFTLPLALMVLKNYFDQLPRSIEEAAMIDGASRLRALWSIVVPLAKPGLTAAGVLIFLEAWSEFFYSLVLTNQLTVPPLLASFQSAQQFNWNGLAAATIIAMIPPVLLTLVFQRNVVGALAAGYEK